MKALILGTGGIGARHASNLRQLAPQCELFAVRSAPTKTTDQLGMALLPDLGTALRMRPDIAVVALPPALHAKAAAQILDAGVHLYLEKPAATRAEALMPSAATAERAGIITFSGCILRRMPGFRRMQDLLRSKALGKPLAGSFSVGSWLPDWRPGRDYRESYSMSRALGGGVIYDLIHELDLARAMLGEFAVAAAVAARSGLLEGDVEDVAEIVLKQGELLVRIHLDYLGRPPHRNGHVLGHLGSLHYDAVAGGLMHHDNASGKTVELAGRDDFSAPAALKDAMAHFLECVERRKPTDQPISDALRSVALAEAARSMAGLPE